MDETSAARIGITTIATYEPPWVLSNKWSGDTIPRKFVHHTGIRFVVLHQAGSRFVEFTGMKLESAGVRGELINGLTPHIGNVSSRSIPYALKKSWRRLHGLVACPTAAVGSPGISEVSQGCILLRSTPLHDRQRQVAA
jgi:hypothetical protein